jgi:hypothetical protein
LSTGEDDVSVAESNSSLALCTSIDSVTEYVKKNSLNPDVSAGVYKYKEVKEWPILHQAALVKIFKHSISDWRDINHLLQHKKTSQVINHPLFIDAVDTVKHRFNRVDESGSESRSSSRKRKRTTSPRLNIDTSRSFFSKPQTPERQSATKRRRHTNGYETVSDSEDIGNISESDSIFNQAVVYNRTHQQQHKSSTLSPLSRSRMEKTVVLARSPTIIPPTTPREYPPTTTTVNISPPIITHSPVEKIIPFVHSPQALNIATTVAPNDSRVTKLRHLIDSLNTAPGVSKYFKSTDFEIRMQINTDANQFIEKHWKDLLSVSNCIQLWVEWCKTSDSAPEAKLRRSQWPKHIQDYFVIFSKIICKHTQNNFDMYTFDVNEFNNFVEEFDHAIMRYESSDKAKTVYTTYVGKLIQEHKDDFLFRFFKIMIFGFADDLDKLIELIKNVNFKYILDPDYYKQDFIIPMFINKIIDNNLSSLEKGLSCLNTDDSFAV